MHDTRFIDEKFGVLDYVPMGVFLLQENYVVLFWNKCLEHWTGIDKDTIVGENISEFFPHLQQPIYSSRLKSIFEGGPPAIFSSQLHHSIIPSVVRGSGTQRIQHVVATAIELSSSRYGALLTIQDVTELSQRSRNYYLLTKKLKSSNQELEAFTYSVSHDLRTPLRAIIGFSKILSNNLKNTLDPENEKYFGIIIDSAKEMGQLIDDLLTLSRIGRKTFSPRRFDLTSLVNEVIKTQRTAGDCQAKMNIEIGDLPACIGDPGLIKLVYTNLISNAIKFSCQKQKPLIEIGSFEKNDENIYFVKDNGIGFDSKYADRIFGVFQRLQRDDTYPGTGVGLAIVQRIIDRHNGRIWATGEKDKGATIYFTLAVERDGVVEDAPLE